MRWLAGSRCPPPPCAAPRSPFTAATPLPCCHRFGPQMYMSMGNWGQAYNEFYEGFRNYQEAGNPNAKVMTKTETKTRENENLASTIPSIYATTRSGVTYQALCRDRGAFWTRVRCMLHMFSFFCRLITLLQSDAFANQERRLVSIATCTIYHGIGAWASWQKVVLVPDEMRQGLR